MALACSSQTRLAAENLFLRKQLRVLCRTEVKPRRLNDAARIALCLLAGVIDWRRLLVVVQDALRWHRLLAGTKRCAGRAFRRKVVRRAALALWILPVLPRCEADNRRDCASTLAALQKTGNPLPRLVGDMTGGWDTSTLYVDAWIDTHGGNNPGTALSPKLDSASRHSLVSSDA
jgi:hypothetical protein